MILEYKQKYLLVQKSKTTFRYLGPQISRSFVKDPPPTSRYRCLTVFKSPLPPAYQCGVFGINGCVIGKEMVLQGK